MQTRVAVALWKSDLVTWHRRKKEHFSTYKDLFHYLLVNLFIYFLKILNFFGKYDIIYRFLMFWSSWIAHNSDFTIKKKILSNSHFWFIVTKIILKKNDQNSLFYFENFNIYLKKKIWNPFFKIPSFNSKVKCRLVNSKV